ncbi:MAG: transketolase [bacterium]|nr:transketolase [bacterium]
MPTKQSHQNLSNALRFLAVDMVEQANSGHPGMPLGMADLATILFQKHLRICPTHPHWPARDRFVLSNGHGSALLYALSYLMGYSEMTLDQLKNFRQLGSKTPGHPERDLALGIETTTGPLGQGLANAVGLALAERMTAAQFGEEISGNFTYCFVGDGCLMEGISYEAASLAGHLRLGHLIVLFDDNGITIDGPTSLSFSEDITGRFQATGWQVLSCDGHNPEQIDQALTQAKQELGRPTLIRCKTTIGFGAPTRAGTSAAHGAPLGSEEIQGLRKTLNWEEESFEVPDAILNAWRGIGQKNQEDYNLWQKKFEALPTLKQKEFTRRQNGNLSSEALEALKEHLKSLQKSRPTLATRQSSGHILDALAGVTPELVGGSADLSGSNNTRFKGAKEIGTQDYAGTYVNYGIREHAMGAVMNGLSLYGGFRPYAGTFLVFSDYCRPAIRLSALMNQPVIYVFTHDSIGLGEDGPTHQPIEHLASLRAMPNLWVMRPCDALEVAQCWTLALARTEGPIALALSRQNLPCVQEESFDLNPCAQGAYVLKNSANKNRQVTLVASGSEVSLALEIQEKLEQKKISAAVVSMPCAELFEEQPLEYQVKTLGDETVYKVSLEAGSSFGWARYTDLHISIDQFGASAPAKEAFLHFGFDADTVVRTIMSHLQKD